MTFDERPTVAVVGATGLVGRTADRIDAIIAEERAAHAGRRVRV